MKEFKNQSAAGNFVVQNVRSLNNDNDPKDNDLEIVEFEEIDRKG